MNLVQQTRAARLGRSGQLCALQPCVLANGHRLQFPVAIGRLLRQRLLAAAHGQSASDATTSHRSVELTFPYADREAPREVSQLASHDSSSGETARPRVAGVLPRLWQVLRLTASSALRVLALAAVFCLASLLPRPSPSHAAAAAAGVPAALTTHSHSRLHVSYSGCGMADAAGPRGAASAVPLAELAASAAFASGPLTTVGSFSFGSSSSSSGGGSGASSLERSSAAGPTTSGSSNTGSSNTGGVGVSSSSSSQAAGLAAAGGPGIGGGIGGLAADPEAAAASQHQMGGLGADEAGVVRLFERNRASVVNISGMRAMQTFTTLDLGKLPYGQGSGFLWGDKGHVVTAYHLVKGAAEVKVTLYDNTSYTAKVIGYDAAKNVAVLKLSVPKSKLRELQPVTLGSAAGLRVGQTVYGIGNPWGLSHTLSKGVVVGLGGELSCGLFPIKGVVLSDAATDPGASGGVLLDSKGALVGMVVTPPASSGGWGGGGGRSFAVPIDAIRGLISQILAYGRTVRPALGITMAPAQVLERVGLEGVLVLEVPPGSPSHAAGLRPTHRDIFGDLVLGDVIVGLDGKPVRSAADLYDILDEHRVGDRVRLDVVRDGKAAGLSVTLGERLLGAVEE